MAIIMVLHENVQPAAAVPGAAAAVPGAAAAVPGAAAAVPGAVAAVGIQGLVSSDGLCYNMSPMESRWFHRVMSWSAMLDIGCGQGLR